MRPAIRFSILGGIVGAVLMFAAVLVIEWQLDKHPSLDTQVIEHLESKGYPVDSMGSDLYAFQVEGDKFVFDYFPTDQTYLRILAGYGAEEYTREDVEAACVEVMSTKKNCIMIPEETKDGMAVRICCESFVSDDDALDTDIIDRAIQLIQQAERSFFRELLHPAASSN